MSKQVVEELVGDCVAPVITVRRTDYNGAVFAAHIVSEMVMNENRPQTKTKEYTSLEGGIVGGKRGN